MHSATASLANSETVEDRLLKILEKDIKKTSLGSEYVAFYTTRSEVVALAKSELVNSFRRVVLDPVRGLVMLMSPSSYHEHISNKIEEIIDIFSDLKGIGAEKMRSTRWRRKTDPKNTGNEADCSFYFGQKAIDYLEAAAISGAAADADSERVPADLVVEVVATHESGEKQLSYRDKGIREYWQAYTRDDGPSGKVSITFLDLQAEPKP